MRASIVVAGIAAFASCVAALPNGGWDHDGWGPGKYDHCLTSQKAHELVNDFIQLTNGASFNKSLANEIIADNIVDTSGSVASVINGGQTAPVPLLGPTLVGKKAWIASNSGQHKTPYKPLNVFWNCDVITFRFEITFKPQPVLGITILETERASNSIGYKIKTVYGELNSWAFLVDLGVYSPNPLPANSSSSS